jgi:hypothetical protein
MTLVSLLGLGCHTMRFELVPERSSDVVTERKSFYLWGLAPGVDVDVLKRCPNGAAAIKEQMTFIDGLLQLPTLGIWSPVTTSYYCRAGAGTASQ